MDPLLSLDHGSVLISSAILAGLFGLGSLAARESGTDSPVMAWRIRVMYMAQGTACIPIVAMISVLWGFYSHDLYAGLLFLMIGSIVAWVWMAWQIRVHELDFVEWRDAVTGKDDQ